MKNTTVKYPLEQGQDMYVEHIEQTNMVKISICYGNSEIWSVLLTANQYKNLSDTFRIIEDLL